MIVLVIISLTAMMANEESNFKYVHQIIWAIFFMDVVIRFIKSSVKWRYIKDNPFDIVTILPLEDSMLLARFARFLRLFRYKNVIKRYADGISSKLEEIGFLRLSIGVLTVNIITTFLLVWFGHFSLVESTIFVWGNFLKFNYATDADGLVVLSVMIKIFGLLYYGIVVKELMTAGREKYEQFKEKKAMQGQVKKEGDKEGIS